MDELNDAKEALIYEFSHMRHTVNDLLGNAGCERKIHRVIVAYVKSNFSQESCEEELHSLMLESGVAEENFVNEIVPEIKAFYRGKELIETGYFDYLKR